MAIDRNGNRQGELTTLQAAATGAANGTALDVTNAVGAVFEVSGTYTNLTVNWEASVDGATWWGVGVGPLTTRTLATTTTVPFAAPVAAAWSVVNSPCRFPLRSIAMLRLRP
jgi:hypothetical protein